MVDTLVRFEGPFTLGADHGAVITRHVGGQAANTAAWLAWLGSPVALAAACGDDPEGEWANERLQRQGVRSAMSSVPGPTGRCVVVVQSDGSRTMFSEPGANGHLARFDEDAWESVLRIGQAPAHVHVSGYLLEREPSLAGRVLALARRRTPDATTSLDTAALPASDSHRAGIESALPHLDVVVGTSEELAGLADLPADTADVAVVDRWRTAMGFSGVLISKAGRHGATAFHGTRSEHVSAVPTAVVDTTGAGDAFAAGFLATWHPGSGELAAAVRAGNEAAAIAVATIGAGPPAEEGR